MPALFEANESSSTLHGSAIMTSDGAIRARFYDRQLETTPVSAVHLASDELLTWRASEQGNLLPIPMAFSTEMGRHLKNFTACVVGVSGTGIHRGRTAGPTWLRPIDLDRFLMRLNSRTSIVSSMPHWTMPRNSTAKVARFASVIPTYRDDIEVLTLKASIVTREAIELAGEGDVLFCCVDSFEGRQVCDRIAAAFLQPLFDVAVTIPTRQSASGGCCWRCMRAGGLCET
jgi:hypothetical protein